MYLKSKLKIEDISGIGGNMKDTSVSALATKTVVNTKNDLGDETVKFNIIKNIETDDLKRFEKVLENRLLVKNNSDFLNISVNSKIIYLLYMIKLLEYIKQVHNNMILWKHFL